MCGVPAWGVRVPVRLHPRAHTRLVAGGRDTGTFRRSDSGNQWKMDDEGLFPACARRCRCFRPQQTDPPRDRTQKLLLMSVCCLRGESERVSVSLTGRVAYSTSALEGSLVLISYFDISILIQWLALVSVLNLSRLTTACV